MTLPAYLIAQQGMFDSLQMQKHHQTTIDLVKVGTALGNKLWPNEIMTVAECIVGKDTPAFNHLIKHAMEEYERLADAEMETLGDGYCTNQHVG